METMQLPLPKKMEYMIRDTLIDKLQSNTLEEVINELLEDMITIDPEDLIMVKRYKNAINLVYTRDELENIAENFILSFKVGKDLINSSNNNISGSIEPLTIGLICAGVGALAGYIFSELDETRIEELEGDTGWDCEFGDYAFTVDVIWETDYCTIICTDRDGNERLTEYEECPDGVSH